MTATKTSKPAKDGTSTAFALEMASESVSGNIANATYIVEPTGETLITPAQDTTLTSGSQKAIARGGQKGTTNTNADITHSPSGANHEALDVALYDGSGNQLGLSVSPVRIDPTGTTAQPVSGTLATTAASGAFVDGSIATIGTQADATWSGSGNSTLVAALKAIYAKVAGVIGVSQSGTWTVQPGNTANTTAWKVDGSAVTQPTSLASLPALAAGSNIIGKIDLLGNTGAAMDAAGQNAASPPNELLVAGQFNTAPTTITSGNVSPLQMDSAGNLLVNIKAGAAAGGTSSNFNSAIPTAGTAAGASDGTNMKPLLVDGSGNLKVNVAAGGAAGGTSSSFSSAFPATGTAIGAKNGANMINLTADGSNNLNVNLQTALPTGGNTIGTVTANLGTLNGAATAAKQPALGTAGTPSTDIMSVQGIASMTPLKVDGSAVTQPVSAASLPLPTGAATAANQPTAAAQGSTTSGQTGRLIQGAVTAAAPSYTNAQTSPISLTTAGAVRTDASATTQPISAASLPLPAGAATAANQATAAAQGSTTSGQTGPLIQGAVTTAAPSYTSGQTSPLSLDTAGNLRVNVTAGGASGNVAQGSTTAGETGVMIQGAVTTSAPTYTTGQTNPISLTTSGGLRVDGSAVTQPVSGTVTANAGTGNFAVNYAQVNGATVAIAASGVQKVGITGNAGAAVDAAGQNAASPANEIIVGGQFNTTPTTITSGNVSPLQMDSAGNLLVNIKAGAAAGGTSSNFASAFPIAGTAIGAKNGANMVNLIADANGNLLVTSLSSGAITNPISTLTRPASATSSSVTATSASPCVFTWTGNPLVNGQTVALGGTAVPGGFTAGTIYYVVNVSGNTFELATTAGGTAINSTSTGTNVTATLVYGPGTLVGSSVTAGSCVVPSFAIATSAGGVMIPRIRVLTSKSSGWGGASLSINLWNTAPTYVNGDAQTYMANGYANWIATFLVTMTQFNDGAAGAAAPYLSNEVALKLASGTSVFWDIQCLGNGQGGYVTLQASQTFTIVPEMFN